MKQSKLTKEERRRLDLLLYGNYVELDGKRVDPRTIRVTTK